MAGVGPPPAATQPRTAKPEHTDTANRIKTSFSTHPTKATTMPLLTKETADLLNGPVMKTASKAEVFKTIMRDSNVRAETQWDDDEDTLKALLNDPQIKSILQERGLLGDQATESVAGSMAGRLLDVREVTESTGNQAKDVASRLLR